MFRQNIILFIIMLSSILLISCSQEEREGTTLTINEGQITMGITEKELSAKMDDENLKAKDYFVSGFSCSDVDMMRKMSNESEENIVFGQKASITYLFDFDDRLHEVWIVWSEGYNQETIMEELKMLYGTDYIEDWLDLLITRKVYRWDMEDGTSILFLPEEKPGNGVGMFMTYTADIEDVEP